MHLTHLSKPSYLLSYPLLPLEDYQKEVKVVWLVCDWIGGKVSKKGRIPVKFASGEKYSLNAEKIRRVLWDGKKYYVDYEVDEKTSKFYKKFEGTPPDYAVEVKLVEKKHYVGEKCNCGIYWDPDTIAEHEMADGVCQCPRCGKVLDIHETTKVHVEKDYDALVERIAEKVAKERGFAGVELVTKCWANISGGTYPVANETVEEKELDLEKLERLRIVRGLTIKSSHYDEIEVKTHYDSDRYHLIVDADPHLRGYTTGTVYYIFKLKEESATPP